jgi:hypothetical protein
MASQKVANCCVAAGKRACETPNCLVIAAYLCATHSSKFARLAFDASCLASLFDDFLRMHQPSRSALIGCGRTAHTRSEERFTSMNIGSSVGAIFEVEQKISTMKKIRPVWPA